MDNSLAAIIGQYIEQYGYAPLVKALILATAAEYEKTLTHDETYQRIIDLLITVKDRAHDLTTTT